MIVFGSACGKKIGRTRRTGSGNLPVGQLAGNCAGVTVWLRTGIRRHGEMLPGNLGIWGAIGVIAALSFLIWQGTVKRMKKRGQSRLQTSLP